MLKMKYEAPMAEIEIGQLRGIALAQRPVGDALDGDGHEGAAETATDNAETDVEDGLPTNRGDTTGADEPAQEEEARKAAGHEDLGVGEVDKTQDAVDQGIADGDHAVEKAVGDAVKRRTPKFQLERVGMACQPVPQSHVFFFLQSLNEKTNRGLAAGPDRGSRYFTESA
jgi:hypothetical protein